VVKGNTFASEAEVLSPTAEAQMHAAVPLQTLPFRKGFSF
jgi:hypothetical protein